jgi:hypothetical protein
MNILLSQTTDLAIAVENKRQLISFPEGKMASTFQVSFTKEKLES